MALRSGTLRVKQTDGRSAADSWGGQLFACGGRDGDIYHSSAECFQLPEAEEEFDHFIIIFGLGIKPIQKKVEHLHRQQNLHKVNGRLCQCPEKIWNRYDPFWQKFCTEAMARPRCYPAAVRFAEGVWLCGGLTRPNPMAHAIAASLAPGQCLFVLLVCQISGLKCPTISNYNLRIFKICFLHWACGCKAYVWNVEPKCPLDILAQDWIRSRILWKRLGSRPDLTTRTLFFRAMASTPRASAAVPPEGEMEVDFGDMDPVEPEDEDWQVVTAEQEAQNLADAQADFLAHSLAAPEEPCWGLDEKMKIQMEDLQQGLRPTSKPKSGAAAWTPRHRAQRMLPWPMAMWSRGPNRSQWEVSSAPRARQLHLAGCSLAPCHVPRELNQWADELTHIDYGGFSAELRLDVREALSHFILLPRLMSGTRIDFSTPT